MARRSCILTYHSLDDSGSVISTPPSLFRRQMEFLADSRIPVVPLDQTLRRPGSVAITFDDGFSNIAEQGLPVLDRYHFPATIFAVSRFCGGHNNWPSQPLGTAPTLPLLSWEDLRQMPARIAVGSHTSTHPFLSRLTPEACEAEIVSCRDEIEQRLGSSVPWLAYPYGDLSPEVRGIASRHFDLAVSTSLRFLSSSPDALDLPRIDTYYLRGSFPINRLFRASGALYIGARAFVRNLRRLTASGLPSTPPARRS